MQGDFYRVWWRQWSKPSIQQQLAHATIIAGDNECIESVNELQDVLDVWRRSVVDGVLLHINPSLENAIKDDNFALFLFDYHKYKRWLQWQAKLVNMWCVEKAQCLLRETWCPSTAIIIATTDSSSTLQSARRWSHLLGLPLVRRCNTRTTRASSPTQLLERDCLSAIQICNDDNEAPVIWNDGVNCQSVAFRVLRQLCGGTGGIDAAIGERLLRQSSHCAQHQNGNTRLAQHFTFLIVLPRVVALRLTKRQCVTRAFSPLHLPSPPSCTYANFFFLVLNIVCLCVRVRARKRFVADECGWARLGLGWTDVKCLY